MSFLSDFNIFAFSKKIKRPLILDGAMGSLLESEGKTSNDVAWSAKANLKFPERIIQIHKDYILAGADIITTNTFRTNPSAMNLVGIKNYKRYLKKAVELAFEAKKNLPVLVAGSNPPAEDCYQKARTLTKKELELNHKSHIDSLADEGCHFILNETQSHFDEIKIITNHCDKNEIPYVLSIYFDENLHLLSGESIDSILKFLLDSSVLAVSFNCISNSLLLKALSQISLPHIWGYYLNCYSTNPVNSKCSISVADFLLSVQEIMIFKPVFIGACCGSNPDFIRAIKGYFDARIKY